MKNHLWLPAFLWAMMGAAQAQDDPATRFASTITQEDLKKHLVILASDAYEGRETGEKGQKMAAEYIQKHFEGIQLSGPVPTKGNPYLQSFELYKTSWKEVRMEAGKEKLTLFDDFFPYGNYHFPTKEVEVVMIGYGIETEAYNDFAQVGDLTGKVVVLMQGEPKKADGTFLLSGSTTPSEQANTMKKLANLRKKGAAGAIILYESADEFAARSKLFKNYFSRPSLSVDKSQDGGFLMLYAAPSVAYKVMGLSAKKYDKQLAATLGKQLPAGGSMRAKATLTALREMTPVSTENVLGFMEGTDLKEEVLVVTAHYDHIGISQTGEGDRINNGADDDGSGTVTVLEIAEAFAQAKAAGQGPRRSILFMTVTGEEKGLLGSKYYSENPVFPIEKTVTNLNIDMVGRVDKKHEANPNYIYLIGSDMLSTELHNLSEATAKKYAPDVELDYQYNAKDDPNRFYYRSDHYNFAKFGIPVIFYFNGTHEDYHRPSDEVEKIQFPKMEKIARLVFHTAWEIANRDQRPTVDKPIAEED